MRVNLGLDFFYDKDDNTFKVVAYDEDTTNIIKLQPISNEELFRELDRAITKRDREED